MQQIRIQCQYLRQGAEAVDALLQAATGWSVAGHLDGDRLSGIFGDENQKLGPVLAPIVADYLLIIVGALAGVMHATGKIAHATRMAAALYVVKWVGTAVFLTGAASVAIEQAFNFPATRWPGVVAFLLTFLADRWPVWLQRFVGRRLGEPDPPPAQPAPPAGAGQGGQP